MVIVLQTLQVDAEWSQSYCATSWHMTISFFCTSLTCIYGMAGVEAVESRHCQVGVGVRVEARRGLGRVRVRVGVRRARAWERPPRARVGDVLQVQTCSRHRASRHKHVSGWGRAARRNLDADEGAPRVRPSGSGHEARRGHGGSGEGGREACPVASLFGWEPNAGRTVQYGVSRTDRSARQQKYAPRGEHTDGKVSACEK